MEERNIAFVILGIVAVIAIVGLVLLFTKAGTAGQGVYGGAIKGVEYPYYYERGRPAPNLPFPEVKTADTTGKREPENIYTVMKACPGGIDVGYDAAAALEGTGKWRCERVPTASGGNCCYSNYPA